MLRAVVDVNGDSVVLCEGEGEEDVKVEGEALTLALR